MGFEICGLGFGVRWFESFRIALNSTSRVRRAKLVWHNISFILDYFKILLAAIQRSNSGLKSTP